MPRVIPVVLCAVALAAVGGQARAKGPVVEPDDGPDPRGLTLTGTGLAYVTPPARPTDASIGRAVDAAKPRAMARAVAQARARAQALAATAGLTLGDVQAVAERDTAAETGFFQERYCSTGRRSRCRVPLFSAASVAVTFATVETSAAVPAGRALVAVGDAAAGVRPRNRRSSASIRHALETAHAAAVSAALARARVDADRLARGAGIAPGTLFSLAEVRRPFDEPGAGPFGPGRFCGTIRRSIVRRDPATGRRRVVRRVSERRCFFSSTRTVALRATFLPQ
jgi:hypothetical protein